MKNIKIIILFCIILISKTVYGQEDSTIAKPADNYLYDLSLEDLLQLTIETASKRTQNISDAPAMVYVITKDQIRNRGYSFLKDVFRDLPGLGVHENYFSETGTQVAVRGIVGNNKIITLVDGIRTNPPGNEDQPIRSDISVRNAEQIEIIYGPGSTLYGADAISMVVNIISQKADDNLSVDANLSGGMNNHKEGYLAISKKLGDEDNTVGISGYLSWVDTDLDDLKDTYPDLFSQYVAQDGGQTPGIADGTVRFDKGVNAMIKVKSNNSSLTFWHRESQRSSSEGGYTPILQFTEEAKWHDRTSVVEAKNNFSFSDRVQLESSLTFSKYEISPDSRYVFNGAGQGSPLFLNDWKFGTGLRGFLEEKISIKVSDNFSLVAGGLLSYRQILPKATTNRSDEPGINADDQGLDKSLNLLSQGQNFVWYTDSTDVTKTASVSNYTLYTYNNYAGYIEGQYEFNEFFKVVGGFRLDKDTRFKGIPFSPRLALIANPNKNLSIKGILTRAFVNPAPYFNFAAFNGTNFLVPNPDLEPEIAQSIELNTTYTTRNYFIGASLFYNTQDKILTSGDLGQSFQLINDKNVNPVFLDSTFTATAGVSQSVNGGETRVIGGDLYGRWNVDNVSLWGSFSTINFSGKNAAGVETELDAVAKSQVRLGVTTKWFSDKLVTTASFAWRSPLTRVDGVVNGLSDEVNRVYSINAFVSYRFSDRFDVYVNVSNLTDNRYATRGVLGPTPQESLKIIGGLRFNL